MAQSRIQRVFVDMDGVIVDFTGAAMEFLKMPKECLYLHQWDDLHAAFGFADARSFWDGFTPEFWENLPKTEEADVIMGLLEEYDPVILSAPAQNNILAKQNWIRKNYPKVYKERRYAFTYRKHLLAAPGRVLVDDADYFINAWEKHGGHGILFPRSWNTRRYVSRPIEAFKTDLNYLKGEPEYANDLTGR